MHVRPWLPAPAIAASAILAGAPAIANDTGHCVFKLYSELIGRALEVCQSAEGVADCAQWPEHPEHPDIAFAEEKQTDRLQFRRGACPTQRALAVCQLQDSQMYFYEGETEWLEEGCKGMKGEIRWLSNDAHLRPLRVAEPAERGADAGLDPR